MNHEYYILTERGHSGPYDLVALVIKIRNGSLPGSVHIQRSDTPDPKLAQDWDELREFFNPTTASRRQNSSKVIKKLYMLEALKNGLTFLQHNQISAIFSGLLILLTVLMTAMMNFLISDQLQVIGYAFGFVLLYYLLSCYTFLILRMTRGQQTDVEYLIKKIGPVSLRLLSSSLIISFPFIIGIILFTCFEDDLLSCLIGLLIIIGPGIYVITIFSFAQLLIIDRGYEVREALETSHSAIKSSGTDNFGVYFSLNMINLIAGLCLIFPMAITLPVTLSGITESYDELLS